MASITIRNIPETLKKRLRRQAAENGRSMEAEAREILTRAIYASEKPRPLTGYDLLKPLRDVVEKYGGVELELPPRTPMRPIDLGWDDSTGTKSNRRGRAPAGGAHPSSGEISLREEDREFRHAVDDKPLKKRHRK